MTDRLNFDNASTGINRSNAPISPAPVVFGADTVNVLKLEDIGLSMEAVENKILVLVDEFKTGYECKECGGTGRVKSAIVEHATVECDKCKGKGALLVTPENTRGLPSTGIIVSMGPDTKYMTARREYEEIFEWPEDEMSPEIKTREIELAAKTLRNVLIRVGARIVFGVHTGTRLPIRGGINLLVMLEKEPLTVIYGNQEVEVIDTVSEVGY